MIKLDPQQVLAARQGSRAALAALIAAAERPVYNLAVRMLANRADAEDATQEILIKILTHLGAVREAEAAGAWALKVACRHLVERRKQGRIEALGLTFTGFAADLEQGLEPPPAGELSPAELAAAMEEVKIGCTLAMLVCLSRELRIAYVLGDIFELTDSEAAATLEIAPSAYRQRLRRARAAVTGFVAARCGVVAESAACRCERRIAPALRLGRIVRGQAAFDSVAAPGASVARLRERIGRLEQSRAAAALMRSNPDFTSCVASLVMAALDEAPRRE